MINVSWRKQYGSNCMCMKWRLLATGVSWLSALRRFGFMYRQTKPFKHSFHLRAIHHAASLGVNPGRYLLTLLVQLPIYNQLMLHNAHLLCISLRAREVVVWALDKINCIISIKYICLYVTVLWWIGTRRIRTHCCYYNPCWYGVQLVWCWCSAGMVLVLSWYGVGVQLVYCWYGIGVQLVSCWCSVGILLVLGWYGGCVQFVPVLVFRWFGVGVQLAWYWCSAGMVLVFSWYGVGIRLAWYGQILIHSLFPVWTCSVTLDWVTM